MNKDIRLKVTFPNHKKTIKLIHLIGAEGFYSLVQLWCYVAQNHPKGILKDYDKYDLEIAARWTGEKGEFTKAVTRKDINFVKKIAKGFEINDWEEHNPYVFHADERSEKARLAAQARWKPSKDKGLSDASSIDVALPPALTSNAPSPDPSPSPLPKPKKKVSKGKSIEAPEAFTPTDSLLKFFDKETYWKENQKDLIDSCLDNFRAKGEKKIDWEATIRNWCRNDKKWNPKNYDSKEEYTMPGLDGGEVKLRSMEEVAAHKILLAKAASERSGPNG